MKLVIAVFSTLILLLDTCRGADSVYRPDLTFAEFRRMPGVEVFLEPLNSNPSVTEVFLELLDHANYLGENLKPLQSNDVTAYIAMCDSEKHFVVEAPLRMQRISSGESRSGKPKFNFTLIRFAIASKLLANTALRFNVQPERGGGDIRVYFGAQDNPQ